MINHIPHAVSTGLSILIPYVLPIVLLIAQLKENRKIEQLKHKQEKEIIKVKHEFSTEVEALKNHLSTEKEYNVTKFQHKFETYKGFIEMIAEFIASLDKLKLEKKELELPIVHTFNRSRLKIYGFLALVAPQTVMDAHDELIDFIMEILEGKHKYDSTTFIEIRNKALCLVNCIRSDLELAEGKIKYQGKR